VERGRICKACAEAERGAGRGPRSPERLAEGRERWPCFQSRVAEVNRVVWVEVEEEEKPQRYLFCKLAKCAILNTFPK